MRRKWAATPSSVTGQRVRGQSVTETGQVGIRGSASMRYVAKDVAQALGYTSAAGVTQAIRRIDTAGRHARKRIRRVAKRPTNGQ